MTTTLVGGNDGSVSSFRMRWRLLEIILVRIMTMRICQRSFSSSIESWNGTTNVK